MGNEKFNLLKEWMEELYGETNEMTIVFKGVSYTGFMYGDDECFDCNDFFQYFLTVNGNLYKMYFNIEEVEIEHLDYNTPYKIIMQNTKYLIEHVILI